MCQTEEKLREEMGRLRGACRSQEQCGEPPLLIDPLNNQKTLTGSQDYNRFGVA